MGKNLENNKKAFAELKKNPDGRSVFSRDGFIEYQQGLSTIVYGKVTASYGGCGAIAVWNLLKALSIAPDEAVVFDEMEMILKQCTRILQLSVSRQAHEPSCKEPVSPCQLALSLPSSLHSMDPSPDSLNKGISSIS